MVIDPAAGGPQSDFAFLTFYRLRGQVTVRALRPHVLHLELALEVVHALRLLHQEARHDLRAQHLQEAHRLVRAHGLQPQPRLLQHPAPKFRVEVEDEEEEASIELGVVVPQELLQLLALLLLGDLRARMLDVARAGTLARRTSSVACVTMSFTNFSSPE